MVQLVNDAAARPGFGDLLARWRKTRRLSQLGLALEAQISSRHVSFIETGRARPSREMVLRLCRALDVPVRERNDLLVAAGFAPVARETPLEAPEMQPMLAALRLILSRHDPFGAVAMDRDWDIVMASHAYAGFVNACGTAARGPEIAPLALTRAPRPNMLRLLCHPEGHRGHAGNWAEIVGQLLVRVESEVARDPNPKRQALLAECLSYPDVAAARATAGAQSTPPLVIPVALPLPDGTMLKLLSTMATLGTAEDITLRELRIEAFYPADEAAARWGREQAA